jgi:tetratricopeptide (TPR) repeat protein
LLSELGSAHLGLGQVYSAWGMTNLRQPEEALASFARAEAVYQGQVDSGNATREDVHQLGTIAGARMMVCFDLGRFDEAVALGEKAVQLRLDNVAAEPEHVAYRNTLAVEANNLSYVLLSRGQAARALRFARINQEQLAALEAADPAFEAWRDNRIQCSLHLARALAGVGKEDEALPLLQRLVAHVGDSQTVRACWARLEMAQVLSNLGRQPEAQPLAAAALPVLQQAAARAPGDAHFEGLYTRCLALTRASSAAP